MCPPLTFVFDRYIVDSLKNSVREKRGSGTRFKLQANGKVPTKWTDFLFVSKNKEKLFQFLAREIGKLSFDEDKQVLVTLAAKF